MAGYVYDCEDLTVSITAPGGYEAFLHHLVDGFRGKVLCLRDDNMWGPPDERRPSASQEFIRSTALALSFPTNHPVICDELDGTEAMGAALLLCLAYLTELKEAYFSSCSPAANKMASFRVGAPRIATSVPKFATIGATRPFDSGRPQPQGLIGPASYWMMVPGLKWLQIRLASDYELKKKPLELPPELAVQDCLCASSVEHIILRECELAKSSLEWLLQTAKTLKTLVMHMETYNVALESSDIELSSLKKQLTRHKDSLTTLAVIVKPEELGEADGFGDLVEFTKLKMLACPLFMADNTPLVDWLPPSIENLAIDVFDYESPDSTIHKEAVTFALDELSDLAENREKFPNLRHIFLQGHHGDLEEAEYRMCKKQCKEVGISLVESDGIATIAWDTEPGSVNLSWVVDDETGSGCLSLQRKSL